jgi:adenylate cyclase
MPQPMRAHSAPPQPRSVRTPNVRHVRLVTGLVLFTYVTLHFANHALGNISIDAMESGLAIQKAIWQSTPGAITLYAAMTIHMGLGF